MKMHFGYDSITVNQRGAHDMAAVAKPRITRDKLKCGDLIFFGPKGPSSSVESIYHAGLYLGRGWFIHSTGSSDGVTHLLAQHVDVLQAELRLGPPGAHGRPSWCCRRLRRLRPPRRPPRNPPAPSPQATTASPAPISPAPSRPRSPEPDPTG